MSTEPIKGEDVWAQRATAVLADGQMFYGSKVPEQCAAVVGCLEAAVQSLRWFHSGPARII